MNNNINNNNRRDVTQSTRTQGSQLRQSVIQKQAAKPKAVNQITPKIATALNKRQIMIPHDHTVAKEISLLGVNLGKRFTYTVNQQQKTVSGVELAEKLSAYTDPGLYQAFMLKECTVSEIQLSDSDKKLVKEAADLTDKLVELAKSGEDHAKEWSELIKDENADMTEIDKWDKDSLETRKLVDEKKLKAIDRFNELAKTDEAMALVFFAEMFEAFEEDYFSNAALINHYNDKIKPKHSAAISFMTSKPEPTIYEKAYNSFPSRQTIQSMMDTIDDLYDYYFPEKEE